MKKEEAEKLRNRLERSSRKTRRSSIGGRRDDLRRSLGRRSIGEASNVDLASYETAPVLDMSSTDRTLNLTANSEIMDPSLAGDVDWFHLLGNDHTAVAQPQRRLSDPEPLLRDNSYVDSPAFSNSDRAEAEKYINSTVVADRSALKTLRSAKVVLKALPRRESNSPDDKDLEMPEEQPHRGHLRRRNRKKATAGDDQPYADVLNSSVQSSSSLPRSSMGKSSPLKSNTSDGISEPVVESLVSKKHYNDDSLDAVFKPPKLSKLAARKNRKKKAVATSVNAYDDILKNFEDPSSSRDTAGFNDSAASNDSLQEGINNAFKKATKRFGSQESRACRKQQKINPGDENDYDAVLKDLGTPDESASSNEEENADLSQNSLSSRMKHSVKSSKDVVKSVSTERKSITHASVDDSNKSGQQKRSLKKGNINSSSTRLSMSTRSESTTESCTNIVRKDTLQVPPHELSRALSPMNRTSFTATATITQAQISKSMEKLTVPAGMDKLILLERSQQQLSEQSLHTELADEDISNRSPWKQNQSDHHRHSLKQNDSRSVLNRRSLRSKHQSSQHLSEVSSLSQSVKSRKDVGDLAGASRTNSSFNTPLSSRESVSPRRNLFKGTGNLFSGAGSSSLVLGTQSDTGSRSGKNQSLEASKQSTETGSAAFLPSTSSGTYSENVAVHRQGHSTDEPWTENPFVEVPVNDTLELSENSGIEWVSESSDADGTASELGNAEKQVQNSHTHTIGLPEAERSISEEPDDVMSDETVPTQENKDEQHSISSEESSDHTEDEQETDRNLSESVSSNSRSVEVSRRFSLKNTYRQSRNESETLVGDTAEIQESERVSQINLPGSGYMNQHKFDVDTVVANNQEDSLDNVNISTIPQENSSEQEQERQTSKNLSRKSGLSYSSHRSRIRELESDEELHQSNKQATPTSKYLLHKSGQSKSARSTDSSDRSRIGELESDGELHQSNKQATPTSKYLLHKSGQSKSARSTDSSDRSRIGELESDGELHQSNKQATPTSKYLLHKSGQSKSARSTDSSDRSRIRELESDTGHQEMLPSDKLEPSVPSPRARIVGTVSPTKSVTSSRKSKPSTVDLERMRKGLRDYLITVKNTDIQKNVVSAETVPENHHPEKPKNSIKQSRQKKNDAELAVYFGGYVPLKRKKPAKYVTDKMYKFIEKKLRPKWKLETKLQTNEFVQFMCEQVKLTIKRKTKYHMLVDSLRDKMAALGIIETEFDFRLFIEEYLPYEFREKAIPCFGSNLGPPSISHAQLHEKL